MDRSIKDYIKIYDNALDSNICRNIVELAKNTEMERWERQQRPQWNMFNVTEAAENQQVKEWLSAQNQVIPVIQKYSKEYMEEFDCVYWWPPQNALEQMRLKHYDHTKGDMFDTHVDVGDHASAKRFLSLFFYLNTVDEGGETYFTDLDYNVKAKEGRLLIFPPTWMYPHAGKPPISNDKYLLGTYLHYI